MEDFHFENFFAHNLTSKKQFPAFAWGFKKACRFAQSVEENSNKKFLRFSGSSRKEPKSDLEMCFLSVEDL